jgi:FKBP-type peptidyl-prolyl cis-trans isomerase FklB
MKKYLFAGFAFLALQVQAQKTPPKKTTPAKPAVVNSMKNSNDSVSYAIGLMVANFYKQQGIKNLNAGMVAKAVNDVYANRKNLMTEQEANACLMSYMNPELSKTLDAGIAFLANNKKRAGVKTTASGLQYEVLKQGTGEQPSATDTVTVNYVGTLINGTEFDNSYKRGEPISFPLNGVIRGWTEALQLMNTGSKYKLYLPQELGYGMNGHGPIPGGSVLVFEVELLGIKKNKG